MRRIIALWLVVSGISCATVPREAVELSVTVGRDLAEVHRAHRELAIRYYARITDDINTFVDQVYRPYAIQKAMAEFHLLDRIAEAQRPGAKNDPVDVMDVFVTEVLKEIEVYRGTLLEPVRKQREGVTTMIDDAYLQLQNGHAIVTGHLASVRKVEEAQADLLKKVKMEDVRERFIAKAVHLSDGVESLVEKGRRGEESIDKVSEKLVQLVNEPEKDADAKKEEER